MKILLTTTSFQDTPGKHHELLNKTSYKVDKLRGPVKQEVLLPIIADYDGVICGDDEFSSEVIEKGVGGKLKVISKYGVGLDKIDLVTAQKVGIQVFNTPNVNQVAVAEHALALILTFLKNVHLEYNITRNGKWERLISNELYGKKVGVLGLGNIGKELIKRLSVFGVELFAYDIDYDEAFIRKLKISKARSIEDLLLKVDILSIHLPLTEITKHSIDEKIISKIKKQLIIVNTSRALIIDQNALIDGINTGRVYAYLTDVLDNEPIDPNSPFKYCKNIIITPHIGSRTFENVERQGSLAVENLIKYFSKTQ